MRPLIVPILLALGVCAAYASRAATPVATTVASTAKPAEAHARRAACRKQATAKKLSGSERQAFINHCVANRLK